MQTITLTLYSLYKKNEGNKKSVAYNPYDVIYENLKRESMEKYYPIVIGEFIRAYTDKDKIEITSIDDSKYDSEAFMKRFNVAAKGIWTKIFNPNTPPPLSPKQFAIFILEDYKNFEKAQDKFWKAPNGFDEPQKIKNENAFLDIISRHVYSITEFEKIYNIKPRLQPNGEEKRPNQRLMDNAVRILPMAIFDIDNGMTIDEADKILENKNIAYSIVTTKSHSDKGDRFRVFVPLTFSKLDYFKDEGLKINESDVGIKKMLIEEFKYIQIEIARELGILDACDLSPLGDVSRKYMPSPPPGAWNHRSIVKLEKGLFDIIDVVQRAKELKRIDDEEKAKRKQEYLEKYGNSRNILEFMKDNPLIKYVYAKDYIALIDPAEIIYKYEMESGEAPKFINPASNNPRIKVSGHEYAIKWGDDQQGYYIKDFVTDVATNLLGYLRIKFPGLEKFERLVKLKHDFPDIFKEEIIKENPYFYLNAYVSALEDASSMSENDIRLALQSKKIADAIFFKENKMVVKKMNGYTLFFDIKDNGDEKQIDKKHPLVERLVNARGAFAQRKYSSYQKR